MFYMARSYKANYEKNVMAEERSFSLAYEDQYYCCSSVIRSNDIVTLAVGTHHLEWSIKETSESEGVSSEPWGFQYPIKHILDQLRNATSYDFT